MGMSNFAGRPFSWSRALLSVVVLVCLFVDFFPHHGAPDFRYTGSDPAYAVWNFGWPLALFIFDPRNGLHLGPLAGPVLLPQIFLLGVGLIVIGSRSREEFEAPMNADDMRRVGFGHWSLVIGSFVGH